jgi:hypothetical protein
MPNAPELSQLRALLFCRQVNFTDKGIDLLQVHDRRLATSFPARFDELVLYASFETGEPGAHNIQLWWRLGDEAPGLMAETKVSVNAQRVAYLRQPFDSWRFPTPGAYKFALYCEGTLVGATSLDVQLATAGAAG